MYYKYSIQYFFKRSILKILSIEIIIDGKVSGTGIKKAPAYETPLS